MKFKSHTRLTHTLFEM
ncbi:hypothetical protein EYZ11_005132 [Aspergillus tanneri]|uniref:Uncharacterized protein n=1 Tax=Aspergillus tanneri TaxID=1220188 RepID=A0A4S3JL67_9EURO|nr:hypothetical protein EYZ11_005132 [Aspergillus tanneri]